MSYVCCDYWPNAFKLRKEVSISIHALKSSDQQTSKRWFNWKTENMLRQFVIWGSTSKHEWSSKKKLALFRLETTRFNWNVLNGLQKHFFLPMTVIFKLDFFLQLSCHILITWLLTVGFLSVCLKSNTGKYWSPCCNLYFHLHRWFYDVKHSKQYNFYLKLWEHLSDSLQVPEKFSLKIESLVKTGKRKFVDGEKLHIFVKQRALALFTTLWFPTLLPFLLQSALRNS